MTVDGQSPVGINKRIADNLLKDGRIDATDCARAIDTARRKGQRIEEVIIELGILREVDLLKYIATLHKTQFVSTERMSKAKVDKAALELVPKKMSQHFHVFPLVLDRVNDKLIVATADPDDTQAMRELRLTCRVERVVPMVARPEAVAAAIDRGYRNDRSRFQQLLQSTVTDFADMLGADNDGRRGGKGAAGDVDWSKQMLPERGQRRRRGSSGHATGEFHVPRRTEPGDVPGEPQRFVPRRADEGAGPPGPPPPRGGRERDHRRATGEEHRERRQRASRQQGEGRRRKRRPPPPTGDAPPALQEPWRPEPRHVTGSVPDHPDDYDDGHRRFPTGDPPVQGGYAGVPPRDYPPPRREQRGSYPNVHRPERGSQGGYPQEPPPDMGSHDGYPPGRGSQGGYPPGQYPDRGSYPQDLPPARPQTGGYPQDRRDTGGYPDEEGHRGAGDPPQQFHGSPEVPEDYGYQDRHASPPGYRPGPPPAANQAVPPPAGLAPSSAMLLSKRSSSMFPRPMLPGSAISLGPISTRQAMASQAEVFNSPQYLESLRVLIGLLENERADLRGHSGFVARLAVNICERVALPQEKIQEVVLASYLHDLGKMGAHHLTALNVAQLETHLDSAVKLSGIPAELLESVLLPEAVVSALKSMYERVGGGGIPEGLQGKDIPIGARILAVADSYADLTRNPANAYERLLTAEEAIDVLRQHSGSVFDVNVLQVLEKATGGEQILTDLLANRHRVLVVDPDPEETMVLQLRLVEQGFDVHVARHSIEARAAMYAREFALIVCEVDLEEPDAGFHLREEATELQNVSWVFVSSRDSRETAERAFELGVDDFIAKPVSTEILVAKLMQLVERKSERMAPRGVSGSLSQMSLPDIVQILWHGRKTCSLNISQGDDEGQIHFTDGQVVNALWGEADGETAFYRMIALGEQGEFSVDPEFVPEEPRAIQASPEGLLLEGMRLLDEGKIP